MLDCPCILGKQIKARPTRCNKWWFIGSYSPTCFGHPYAHRQESRLRATAYGFLSGLWF